MFADLSPEITFSEEKTAVAQKQKLKGTPQLIKQLCHTTVNEETLSVHKDGHLNRGGSTVELNP